MKVLYITGMEFVKDLDTGYLQHFAEKRDITIVSSVAEGQRWILERLGKFALHIDFLLLDSRGLAAEVVDRFKTWLINSYNSYSRGNFRLSALPFIIICDNSVENPFDESRQAFYENIFFHQSPSTIKTEVINKAIWRWLQKIGDDLDYFDLDTTLRFDPQRIPWLLNHRSYRLTVLSEEFFKKMQKLPYLWFGDNISKLDVSFNQFEAMLKKSERFPSQRNEKEIHSILKQNIRLILGEFHSHSHYEKQFYLSSSRQYVESDFLHMPFDYYHQLPEVFEVKLPNQQLVRKNGTAFYSSTKRAFEQVNLKYRQYFSSPDHREEIIKRIKYEGNDFDYTLLIGRQRDKEENLHVLEQYTAGKDLRVVSYDELPEIFQKIYQRWKRFSLS